MRLLVGECAQLLLDDLNRQYALMGQIERRARYMDIFFKCLHPRFLPLILSRLSRLFFLLKIPVVPFVFSYLNLVLFGLQITPRCCIGGGLFLPHPSGIVIGAWRIGCNVTIFQQVTLGAKEIDLYFTPSLLPEICDRVTVGAGAKVLGGIRLAENVIVGANAVVIKPVDKNLTVAGIPARVITSSCL